MKKAAEVAPAAIDSKVAGYKINPALADKYNDQPLFNEKLKRANELLDKAGVPKF